MSTPTPAIPPAIEAALDDDLNTPQALAEMARIAGDARKAETPDRQAAAEIASCSARGLRSGLLQQAPVAWFERGASGDDDIAHPGA